jgi:NADPH:quinone reductase-like Zn-dependent oxidoreductase
VCGLFVRPVEFVDQDPVQAGASAAVEVPGAGEGEEDFAGEASTVVDSLRLVRRGGTVCVAGSLSGWQIRDFEPIAMIPSGTRLTAFHSNDARGSAGAAVLERVVRNVEAGVYRPNVDRVFGLDDVATAHRYMEDNQATGKVLMLPHGTS